MPFKEFNLSGRSKLIALLSFAAVVIFIGLFIYVRAKRASTDKIKLTSLSVTSNASNPFHAHASLAENISPKMFGVVLAVRSSAPSDEKLVGWMERIHPDLEANTILVPENQNELEAILAKTAIKSISLFHIAHAYEEATRDFVGSDVIYIAAISRIDNELNDHPGGLSKNRELLSAINDAKACLWDRANAGDHDAAYPLYLLNLELLHCIDTKDQSLKRERDKAAINVVESLFLMDKIDEAVAAVRTIDARDMAASETDAIAWIRSLIALKTENYQEAISPLRICSNSTSFRYREAAMESLIIAQARMNLVEDAHNQFEILNKLYGSQANLDRFRALSAEIVTAESRIKNQER